MITILEPRFKNNKSEHSLIKKIGYKEKTVELKNNSNTIIQLELKPSELNEVTIISNLLPKKLKQIQNAIHIITLEDIQQLNNINFAPVMNRIPDVFMQSGALNTNRITIRGIGSRNLFGTSKLEPTIKT